MKTANSEEDKMFIRNNINMLNIRINRMEQYIFTHEKELKEHENGIYLFIYLFNYLIKFLCDGVGTERIPSN